MVRESGETMRARPSASFAPPTPPAMARTCGCTSLGGDCGRRPSRQHLCPRGPFERRSALAAVAELVELDQLRVRTEAVRRAVAGQVERFGCFRFLVET